MGTLDPNLVRGALAWRLAPLVWAPLTGDAFALSAWWAARPLTVPDLQDLTNVIPHLWWTDAAPQPDASEPPPDPR